MGGEVPARKSSRDIARIRGAKRVGSGSAFGGGPAVDDCDEQQNVDRNYAVINSEACAHVHARVHAHRRGVGRLHRWLGIFVFSGWHRPTFTRLHAPSGCVICMFAVTEENLNQPPPSRPPSPPPLYNARCAASRPPLVPTPCAAVNSDKPCRKLVGRFAILFLPVRRQVLTTCRGRIILILSLTSACIESYALIFSSDLLDRSATDIRAERDYSNIRRCTYLITHFRRVLLIIIFLFYIGRA